MAKERNEAAVQFDEIYVEYHDPIKSEERKILDNRKKRGEKIKEDLGME